eukprot:5696320-Amphidinium_carterae.1
MNRPCDLNHLGILLKAIAVASVHHQRCSGHFTVAALDARKCSISSWTIRLLPRSITATRPSQARPTRWTLHLRAHTAS